MTTPYAGHYICTAEGLHGHGGQIYNYVMAGNGLFINCCNEWLDAMVCISDAKVRGLPPLEAFVTLRKGKIPLYIYDLAISQFYTRPFSEYYLAVIWDGEYHIREPRQERKEAKVVYQPIPGAALDIHSHGLLPAFFSLQDDEDDQSFCIYMVVGLLHSLIPEISIRVGIYGYTNLINLEDVFECTT